jgi:hypothetical protein
LRPSVFAVKFGFTKIHKGCTEKKEENYFLSAKSACKKTLRLLRLCGKIWFHKDSQRLHREKEENYFLSAKSACKKPLRLLRLCGKNLFLSACKKPLRLSAFAVKKPFAVKKQTISYEKIKFI